MEKRGLEGITNDGQGKINEGDKFYISPKSKEGYWGFPISIGVVGGLLALISKEDMRALGFVMLGVAGLLSVVNIHYSYEKKKGYL